ncbi:MAG: hypothetical protein PWQ57_1667 [Desulfovibrionales bacterium]|jgi:hypothetical protein|nr:hypothetical protein [Desulfovibrionales bacterium]
MLEDNWGASAEGGRTDRPGPGQPWEGERERTLRDRINSILKERSCMEQRFREELLHLEGELERLRSEADGREGFQREQPAGDGLAAPPSVLLSQPLVVKTSSEEYLGFCGPDRRHFALKDFMGLILQSLSTRSPVEMRWESRDGEWVLVISAQREDACEELRILLVVRRATTPRENTVTQIIRLNINGHEAPQPLILNLFRQIRKKFEG